MQRTLILTSHHHKGSVFCVELHTFNSVSSKESCLMFVGESCPQFGVPHIDLKMYIKSEQSC